MALRQTYLSLKDKLPEGSETVLVMRGRGNDELAPSKELLADFNCHKEKYSNQPRFPTAFHYAWEMSHYEERFREQISTSYAAMDKLRQIAARARSHDVYFICYEAYDKPCHRNLLLEIAKRELHAEVNFEPFIPETMRINSKPKKTDSRIPLDFAPPK